MQNKLKISALFLALFFTITPLTAVTASAQAFDLHIPSFGLYCENKNTDIHGKIKYVIDENGKAEQFSEYTVTAPNGISVYIPFISNACGLPKINFTVNQKAVTGNLRYGESYSDKGGLRFYSSDIDDNLTGTLYTLTADSESFTVDFKTLEKQNFIYRFTDSYTQSCNGGYSYILNNAQPGVTYEIFVINGDFEKFESSARTAKETLGVKEYIDRYFDDTQTYFSTFENITPDLLYALINRATENNVNYDFFDFFYGSFSKRRVNAYKIDLQADTEACIVSYSTPVDVQINNAFKPAIYMAEQTATGNYTVDYSIELNGEFPYIIESSAELKKQGGYLYTAENVSGDFYFVFGSAKKPESIYGNTENNNLKIVLYAVSGMAVCAVIALGILIILHYKKQLKQ